MFNTLARKLVEWRARRAKTGRLRDAQISRSQALQAVQDATERRDDRDLGRAMMVLRQATHEELRRAKGMNSSRDLSQTVGGVR